LIDTLNRQKLVEQAYQKGEILNLRNRAYLSWLEWFFQREYIEDVRKGDVTSLALLPRNKLGKAILKAKNEGIIVGVEEITWFLSKHGIKIKARIQDGERVDEEDAILEVKGKQRDILATERISLNVLQRMSGIATETRRLNNLIKSSGTRIAATRKILWRYLDKKAVYLGGGLTHRLGLWDSLLIKDNHLQALRAGGENKPVEKALVKAAKFTSRVDFIEVEVANQEEAWIAAKKFKQLKLRKPCIIMLDNWKLSEIAQIIEKLRKAKLYNYVLLEASGSITPKNINEYARTGVDVISLGYLTHSARILDMSLEMK
jgi:nicotinate-nucleotide pyrophosphorylase (carboxylating)